MMVPLGIEVRKSVLLKPTLDECGKTSSFEFLYYTKCLFCLFQIQRVSPACISNTGNSERKSIAKSLSH